MDRLRILAEADGYFTRADALAAGHDDKSIGRALRTKLWTRVRHGVYTFSDLWARADPVARHRIEARAVARRLGHNVALSHTSAALEHGLTVWDVDLSLIHVTRLDGGAGRTEAGVVHHEGFCADADVVELDGVLVMKPARAAIETASLGSSESAVVTLDSVLHRHCSTDELAATYAVMQHWPGMQRLQVTVRFADGRAESAGESRSRHLCFVHGLPAPELQFEVYDEHGNLIGTTDFAWPEHKLLGEFDGKVKYGRLLRDGEEPGDVVFREKQREDALREALLWQMIRLVWADLYHGHATAARIRRMMRLAA